MFRIADRIPKLSWHYQKPCFCCRAQLKYDGKQRNMGGEVKGKRANGVGSKYSSPTAKHRLSSITSNSKNIQQAA